MCCKRIGSSFVSPEYNALGEKDKNTSLLSFWHNCPLVIEMKPMYIILVEVLYKLSVQLYLLYFIYV